MRVQNDARVLLGPNMKDLWYLLYVRVRCPCEEVRKEGQEGKDEN